MLNETQKDLVRKVLFMMEQTGNAELFESGISGETYEGVVTPEETALMKEVHVAFDLKGTVFVPVDYLTGLVMNLQYPTYGTACKRIPIYKE